MGPQSQFSKKYFTLFVSFLQVAVRTHIHGKYDSIIEMNISIKGLM